MCTNFSDSIASSDDHCCKDAYFNNIMLYFKINLVYIMEWVSTFSLPLQKYRLEILLTFQCKRKTLYLAVFIDFFSQKIVICAMDTRKKNQLVITTFNKTYGKEHPDSGLIVHTDQCAQFTRRNFQILLKVRKTIHSESRKCNLYYNALILNYFIEYKKELIQDAHFAIPKQAQKEIFKYIGSYYNTKYIPSSLGYCSPSEFEKASS